MPRQDKSCPLYGEARDAGRDVIASHVCVDYLDVVIANKIGDPYSAQDPKRIPHRNVKDVLRRKKCQTMLPVAGRSQRNVNIVTAGRQAAT